MTILGIDASSANTGWAVIKGDNIKNAEVLAFGEIELTKFKKKKFPLEYVLVLFNSAVDLLQKYKPSHIYLEDIYYARNILTYKSLARMRGIIEAALLTTGFKTIKALSTMTLRDNVLGTGKFDKSQVCAILEKRYNITLATEGYDQSDSLLVALGGMLDATNQIVIRPRKRKPRAIKSSNDYGSKTRRKRSK